MKRNPKSKQFAATQSNLDIDLVVAKRNREVRTAVLAVLAAAAMSPMAVQRAEAAPAACVANGGDLTDVNCTGDQSQGVTSTGNRDFDPNIVDTVNVRNLTTNIQTPNLPAASRGVNYELQGPYGNGGVHNVTLNLTGTAGTPIRVNTNNATAVLVETFSGPAYDGRGATSGFLCAGAHSADEGQVGATGNILSVNLSNLSISATGANSYGLRAANSAGNGGYGGGGSMCYSSEAGGVGGHGGVLQITGTNANISTVGANATGISASSAGGDGGHGGNGGSFRFGSRGGIGGVGGEVRLSGTGTITTNGSNSLGIFAISVGGNGGDGGSSDGFGGGGNGPYGAGGGLVHVDSGYDITTLKDLSYGIGAYSLGGHGGSGGDGSFFNPSAGNGGGSGQSGDVYVRSTGKIKTSGDYSFGIVAQSIAGYAGSGGSSNSVVNFGSSGGSAGKGGRVDVFNEGNITTTGRESHAIFAESVGGGGGAGGGGFGAFYAAGGVGGSGGNGGIVYVKNDAQQLSATGRDARGIYAQSIGGAGGDGGDSTGIAALGGRGADTSDGDQVTVVSSGNILSAAHAIYAESIGGGGGNGGDSTGWFSIGGGGGAGGKGGIVSVENHGALTTRQDNSSAIFAHSIGGGGGNGGSSIGVGLGIAFAIGGEGKTGGDGSTVTVISDSGDIVTGANFASGQVGNASHGIYAQSIGGGGGNGGYAFAGSVGSGASLALAIGGKGDGGGAGKAVDVTAGNNITTHGDDANAIFAESVGGGGGNGGFALAVTGSNGLSAAFAVGGQGGGGGASDTVKVTSTGTNLQTFGDRSTGLLAQSVGGGGGNGGFAVAGSFSFSITPSGTAAVALGGKGGSGGGAKDVTVDSSSNISTSGDNSNGLLAQSVGGGGGNGGFAVSASITTGASVNASFGGNGGGGGIGGVVSVGKNAYTTGTIHTRGDNSTGLFAQSVGGGGGNGGFAVAGSISGMPSANLTVGGDGGTARDADAVSVRTANTVITEGDDSHGVVAQSVGGGGGTGGFAVSGSITASGAVGAGFGGKGGGGGNANTVNLSNIGDSIATSGDRSYGVLAQSVGGGGGNGGFAVAGSISQGPGANFGMGGSGDRAGVGRDVFVTSTSAISTLGDEAHGLFVQSIGGGGGSGGFSAAGSMAASGGSVGASIGGSGSGGGTSGRVFVNTIAAGTGAITTAGDRSTGIFAQSVGGGGGSGGFAIGGNITNGPSASLSLGGNGDRGSDSDIVFVNSGSSVATGGDDSHGIYAQSVGGGGGSGGFAVSGSISAGVGNVNAALGGGGAGGGSAKDVTLLSSGASVTTVGTHSYGIAAQSLGGGGGDGGFSVAAGISDGATANLALGGSGAGGGFGRGVYLNSSTAVTTQGNDSHAVFAQSIGGGGGSGGFAVTGGISRANAGASLGGKGAGGGDGGIVTLNNTATTIGTAGDHAYGVIAQSIGGGGGDGGFSVAGGISQSGSAALALGGSGSGGGNGKSVNLSSSSNVATLGDDAHGLFAQSVGGGGGSGGFAVSGALAANGAATASLGGSGAGGGNADAVTLFNSGNTIQTAGDRSYGMVAQSVGGGGGDGGFAVSGSITKGPAANFSMGGSAARGGSSSSVTLNSNSAVTTQGQDSHAIFAQSVGGGGGAGGFSVSGSISADSGTVSASIGGGGGAGGVSGKVTLGDVSAIDGTLITEGDRSYGILAQSVGGGGGDGGFSVAGGISKGDGAKFSMGGHGGAGNHADTVSVRSAATIETSGADAHGIFAQSIGGGGGSGGFSVAGSISTQGSSVNASIGGYGAGGGDGKAVNVQSLGASIDTEGDRSYGIIAQSVGGGGGDGGFSVAGSIDKQKTVNFSLGGSGAAGGNSGATGVLSSTDITTLGAESHGIFAQSLGGGGGSGGFSVAASLFASTTNAPSIDASIGGSGAGGGSAGAVNVGATNNFVSGVIDVSGAGAHGIFAQSLGGGGGNGGFSVAGGLNQSPAIRFSLGGSAGAGSHGDVVNVFSNTTITTRGDEGHGVFAQSLGGGGGNGGFSVAGSASKDTTSVNASIGGFGGGGGHGGDVGVTTSGNIVTLGDKAFGVFAQSVGGGGGNGGFSVAGGLSVPPSGTATKKPANNIEFSMGGFGGNGDRGGNVIVTNTGVIDTFGDASHGVLAQSVGGGGGNGGFSGAGTLSAVGKKSAQTRATISASVGGFGGNGNIGGDVTVTNTRDITTRGADARGVYAYSVGGGGGNGGASYAVDTAVGKVEDNNGLNVELAIGGFGGSGNVGGAIQVTNNGDVVTLGDRGDGVFAQSVGGGGGDGGKAHAVSFDFTKQKNLGNKDKESSWNFTTAVGGNAGSANDGGTVKVTNTGSIDTSGFYARGIVAQSVGGGGGTGGEGIQGTGIEGVDIASEFLDLRDKDWIDVKSWQITVGGNGGASGNAKDVEVVNSGSIVTHGLSSFAIFAQSIGGGGGDAQNFAQGTGTGGKADSGLNSKIAIGGGGGSSGNGAKVTVTNSNSIETFGHEAHGIFAQSIGGGGGVAGNVDRGFADAIGPIPALNIGIGAAIGQAGGGGGNGGDVTITNSGSIVTHGKSAFGILAQSIGGGGGAAGGLGNEGTFAAPVLKLQNFYGSAGGAGDSGIVTVNQTGKVSVEGGNAVGIFAQSTTTDGVSKAVNITTNGDINAVGVGSFGILAQSLGKHSTDQLQSSDNINITINAGTIRGGAGLPPPGAVSIALTDNERGAAINFRDGRNNSLINRGTVGDVSDLTRMAILGEIGNEAITNSGAFFGNMNLGAGANSFVNQVTGTITSGPNLSVGSGGTLTNNGLWSIGNQNVVAQTAISGNLNLSSSARLLVDLDVATTTADHLIVTGGNATVSGAIVLNRMNVEAIKPGTKSVVLVSATGGMTLNGVTLNIAPSAITYYSLDATQSAGATPAALTLNMNTDFVPANAAATMSRNQRALGQYFNSIALAGTPASLKPTIAKIIAQSDALKLTQVYDGLMPDTHLASQSMPFYGSQRFSDALMSCRQLDGDYRFSSEGECSWMNIAPSWRKQDATAEQIGVKQDGMSIAAGFQRELNAQWHLGLGASFEAASLESQRINSSDLAGRSQGEGGNLGAVLKGNFGASVVSISATAGQIDYDSSRFIAAGTASSEQSVNLLAAHVRYGYAIEGANWYLKPGLDAGYTSIKRDAFQESGAGAANLVVAAESNDIFAMQPMLEFGGELPFDNGTRLRLFGRGGVTRIVSGESINLTAGFEGAPSTAAPFTVSQLLDKRTVNLTAGLDLIGANGTVLRIMYTDTKSDYAHSQVANLKVSWAL